jgi:hypothetical protein
LTLFFPIKDHFMGRISERLSVLLLYLELVFCHVFEIKLVEMRESTVPAPYREMPAANSKIMGTGHMAVSAFG